MSQQEQSAVSISTVVDLASYKYFPYESGQGGIKRATMLLIISLHQINRPEYLSLEAHTLLGNGKLIRSIDLYQWV